MLSNFAHLLRESFRGWGRNRRLLLPTLVTVLLAALVLEGTVAAFLVVRRAAPMPEDSWKLELFLSDDLSDAEVAALEERIRGTEGTGDLLFVDKSAAAERFTRAFGPDALDLAGDNPLPRSFDVWPSGEFKNAFRYRSWAGALAALPGVEFANSSLETLERVAEWKARAETLLGALLLLMVLAFRVILGNAVRVSLYARALLIENMKYVGAGERSIAMPFAIESATLALLGGSAAWGVWEFAMARLASGFPAWEEWFAPLGRCGGGIVLLLVLVAASASARTVLGHLRERAAE